MRLWRDPTRYFVIIDEVNHWRLPRYLLRNWFFDFTAPDIHSRAPSRVVQNPLLSPHECTNLISISFFLFFFMTFSFSLPACWEIFPEQSAYYKPFKGFVFYLPAEFFTTLKGSKIETLSGSGFWDDLESLLKGIFMIKARNCYHRPCHWYFHIWYTFVEPCHQHGTRMFSDLVGSLKRVWEVLGEYRSGHSIMFALLPWSIGGWGCESPWYHC